MKKPARRKTYTLEQIFTELILDDTPSFNFEVRRPDASPVECTLQDLHVVPANLLNILGFANTEWVYQYTSIMGTPIFVYSYHNTRPISDFVDIEPAVDPFSSDKDRMVFWCTPKGYPKPQYYSETEDGRIIVTATGESAL